MTLQFEEPETLRGASKVTQLLPLVPFLVRGIFSKQFTNQSKDMATTTLCTLFTVY
jgi:hypothetical protein